MKDFLKQHYLIWIPFLVSIVIGVLLNKYSPIPIPIYNNILLNAVLQILFYLITIYVRIIRIEKLSESIKIIEQINSIGRYERFNDISQDILSKLEQLSKGEYEIKGHPSDIWQEHIECINYLKPGDEIFATCYYPESDNEITKLFCFKKYEEYCNTSIEAIKRGIKLNKIFILRTRTLLQNQKLIEHFRYITEKSEGRFHLIIVDELTTRNGISDIEEDFMIWGSKLLCISLLGDDSIVGGLRMSTDARLINKYKDKFNKLRQISIPLGAEALPSLIERIGNSSIKGDITKSPR